MNCPECENGRIPVTYAEARVHIASNERAMELAGRVHHYENCERCGGKGEIEEDE